MKAIGVDLGGHKIAAGRVNGEIIEARLEERGNQGRSSPRLPAWPVNLERTGTSPWGFAFPADSTPSANEP